MTGLVRFRAGRALEVTLSALTLANLLELSHRLAYDTRLWGQVTSSDAPYRYFGTIGGPWPWPCCPSGPAAGAGAARPGAGYEKVSRASIWELLTWAGGRLRADRSRRLPSPVAPEHERAKGEPEQQRRAMHLTGDRQPQPGNGPGHRPDADTGQRRPGRREHSGAQGAEEAGPGHRGACVRRRPANSGEGN